MITQSSWIVVKLHTSDSHFLQVNPGLSWPRDGLPEPNTDDTAPRDHQNHRLHHHHQQQQQQQQQLQQNQQPVCDPAAEAVDSSVANLDEREEPQKDLPSDVGGLYEDGEIQVCYICLNVNCK